MTRNKKESNRTWLDTPALKGKSNPLVVIAMSGGVDSSVTALKVKEAGYRCEALFIKSWDEEDKTARCQWEDDVADALDVCDKLSIPINTVDLTEDYWDLVFTEFLSEIAQGKTPNPDIFCNKEIKFNTFKSKIRALGGDILATGHYARISSTKTELKLQKSEDKHKDQTYFLHRLSQEQLKDVVFPIGESTKKTVRELANSFGLKNYNKKDSTGICFIGQKEFRPFLKRYFPSQKGPIFDTDGQVVGEHHGAIFYTIGQRKGLGIGGKRKKKAEPWYVVDKDLEKNRLIVGQGEHHPDLYSKSLLACNVSWITSAPLKFPYYCNAKIRYGQPDQACKIEPSSEEKLRIVFEEPQRAITPGQSIVFYTEDTCLGGAIIEKKLSIYP